MPYIIENTVEIELLIEKISQKIREEIYTANRLGNLDNVLEKYGLNEKEESSFYYDSYSAKIIVIGSIEVKQQEIKACLKNVGINPDRVEFYSDYEKLPNIDFSFLRNNMNYSDILVCAMPHKMKGIDGYASLTSMIEDNQNEFPKLTKIGEMKYSNTAFKEALKKTNYYQDMINNG